MKKLTFLMLSFLALTTTSLFAQDAIHGVDGYYNWTPKQMQADGLFKATPTAGSIGSSIMRTNSYVYTNDYFRVNMKLNSVPNNFREDWSLANKYNLANPLKISKKYPVLAIKIGTAPIPANMKLTATKLGTGAVKSWSARWKFHGGSDSTVYTVATTTADGVVHPINAFNTTYLSKVYPCSSYRINTPNGKGGWDSNHRIQIDNLASDTLGNVYHNWNVRNAIGDSVNAAQAYSSTNMGYFMVDDPIADQIVYLNFASVFERDSARYKGDLEIYELGMIMNNFYCDTMLISNKLNEAGDSIGSDTISKPRELLPYYQFKWIKTFASPTALKEATMINAGDGNDSRSDNQLSLNAALYFGRRTLENYANADVEYFDPFQAAYNAAVAIYKTSAPSEDRTSAEWIAWDASITKAITDLNTAMASFKYSITNNITNSYNIIKTAGATSELMVGASATVNGIPGKLVTFGGVGSGTPLVFTKSTTLVGGLTSYALLNSTGRICVVKDTLMFVETKNATALSPTALFVFSNRNENLEPFYDIFVNGKYLILDANTGKLTTATEIPDGEIADLENYLFNIAPATYDASNDNPNLDLFKGWEFNTDFGGWEINRWRMFGTLTMRSRGTSSYAVLGTKPEYYSGRDTLQLTLVTTTFAADGSTGPSFRRESGVYPDASRMNVTTYDSLLMYWTNTYKRRYFAIKTSSNNGVAKMSQMIMTGGANDQGITLTTENILGKKGDVLYWDLLAQGVPYGDKAMIANYMGCNGFTSLTDEVYIDWMRTYTSVDEIPSELVDINADVKSTYENSVVQVFVNDKNIRVRTEKPSTISLVNISGQTMASVKGINETTFTVNNAGIYIVTSLENNQLVTRKVIVK